METFGYCPLNRGCPLNTGFTAHALFLSTWFYHVTLFRRGGGGPRARAKSSKFYSSSMIYERKITMWGNFFSVWFFMQHERWAFIHIILFRAYSIFVHRHCGSVSKSIRLLFRLHCMLMLRYGWCEFWKFQNLVTDEWLIKIWLCRDIHREIRWIMIGDR